MERLKKRFDGLYWRQLSLTAGMVLLTLMLLGASFVALSYNYTREQKIEELSNKAQVVAQLSMGYLKNGHFENQEDLLQLARRRHPPQRASRPGEEPAR